VAGGQRAPEIFERRPRVILLRQGLPPELQQPAGQQRQLGVRLGGRPGRARHPGHRDQFGQPEQPQPPVHPHPAAGAGQVGRGERLRGRLRAAHPGQLRIGRGQRGVDEHRLLGAHRRHQRRPARGAQQRADHRAGVVHGQQGGHLVRALGAGPDPLERVEHGQADGVPQRVGGQQRPRGRHERRHVVAVVATHLHPPRVAPAAAGPPSNWAGG
jgi:hypothetical protein